MFLKLFKMEWGTEADVGYPDPREREAWTLQAFLNFSKIDAAEILST